MNIEQTRKYRYLKANGLIFTFEETLRSCNGLIAKSDESRQRQLIDERYTAESFLGDFVFGTTPQGHAFWLKHNGGLAKFM
jgi:hypothetical protein